MRVPLDVDGQLSAVAGDGTELLLQAAGSVIRIQMPSPRAAYRALRTLGPPRLREQFMARLRSGAVAADLAVQFTVAERLVAELDTQSQGSALARVLGFGAIKLHPMGLIMSLFKKGN